MPDHAAFALAVAAGVQTGGRHHLADGGADRMKLMVTGDLLHQLAVIFKQHEVTQIIEQKLRRQHAAHQGFQLAKGT